MNIITYTIKTKKKPIIPTQILALFSWLVNSVIIGSWALQKLYQLELPYLYLCTVLFYSQLLSISRCLYMLASACRRYFMGMTVVFFWWNVNVCTHQKFINCLCVGGLVVQWLAPVTSLVILDLVTYLQHWLLCWDTALVGGST